jgi:hypothetical protein
MTKKFLPLEKEKNAIRNPGPGAYDHLANQTSSLLRNSQIGTFSKEKRKDISEITGKDKHLMKKSPGPGQYEFPTLVAKLDVYKQGPQAVKKNTARNKK